jgi:hypothetical protein
MTTLLGAVMGDKNAALDKWRKRIGVEAAQKITTAATTRGTHFHKNVELYLSNQLDFHSLDPFESQTFEAALPALNRIDNIRLIEQGMYSKTHKIAGTVDCIGEFDHIPSIIDHKTSRTEKKESWIENYFLQKTGYALMYEEMTGHKIDQIVTIISVAETHSYQVFVKSASTYKPKLIELISEYYQNAES